MARLPSAAGCEAPLFAPFKSLELSFHSSVIGITVMEMQIFEEILETIVVLPMTG